MTTKIGATCGEVVHAPSRVLLRHGVTGAVIREKQIMDYSRRHPHCDLHTPTVEKVPISSVGDTDPWLLITVGAHQHSREHETEQGGDQYATLLHYVGHRKCFGRAPSSHHEADVPCTCTAPDSRISA
ncbi:unnamed protein product [Schistocephalus solidus]|uniref:Transposase n=1 Tax=Schistocephalus solidus TaxID=70667 RepID=A0A183TJH4_SCHSO|nr:unnamed protein product [Schistocephalus solidus]